MSNHDMAHQHARTEAICCDFVVSRFCIIQHSGLGTRNYAHCSTVWTSSRTSRISCSTLPIVLRGALCRPRVHKHVARPTPLTLRLPVSRVPNQMNFIAALKIQKGKIAVVCCRCVERIICRTVARKKPYGKKKRREKKKEKEKHGG